jgi:hypothetical protein
MMSKANDNRPGHAKILEAWEQPADAGEAVGCIATSFTFAPDFFETECLSRFLGLESEPTDGAAYLIEREEKLTQLACAAALVDQHHARGVRNLRWDLLSARVYPGILHAKISLLLWSRCARLIIASANLTPDGYRHNHEVFGVLDYFEDSDAPLPVIREVIDFLKYAATFATPDPSKPGPAVVRWNQFLDRVIKKTRRWGVNVARRGFSQPRVFPILSGPKRPGVFRSLAKVWPETTLPSHAFIVSPFFDPPDVPNIPARELWKSMRTRGSKVVQFEVTGEDIPGQKLPLLHAPQSVLKAQPADDSTADTLFQRLKLEPGRPLHAKCLWLQNDRWCLYQMGSSNFTTAGLGLGRAPNLEANLAYVFCHARSPKGGRLLARGWLESEPISRFRLLTKPVEEDGQDAPTACEIVLPPQFGEAVFSVDGNGRPFVEFTLSGHPPRGWSLLLEDGNQSIYTEKDWSRSGRRSRIRLAWSHTRPPSAFQVRWRGSEGSAWWPVNISHAAALPPPEELRELSLDELVEILTSAGPLHQTMRRLLLRRQEKQTDGPIVDPHRRVDTSGFLLQRTRRVTWALAALRQRLEQPAPSLEALHWRLRGPVGVERLAKAIVREARSDQERCFLVAELAIELARVRPQSSPGGLNSSQIKSELRAVIRDLREQTMPRARLQATPIKRYAAKAFKEACA